MIKTIIAFSPQDLDTQTNDFEKTQSVFATQTHITPMGVYDSKGDMIVQYTAVIFYKVRL